MTESFFSGASSGEVSTAARFDVPRDQYGRRMLPNDAGKTVAWTGITTLARTLEDEHHLNKWKLRQAVWGQAHRPDLIALAGAASKTDKKTLDQVAEAACNAASDHKADLGTALHNILARVDAGLPLSEVPEYFHPLVHAYRNELSRHNIEILPDWIERAVVSNLYHVDGIGDRWVRMPEGRVVYMDIKTGDDPGKYPHKPTIQLALCANADAAIDHATGLQVPMPEVDKAFALVMHIDPLTATVRLLRNDAILAGWAAVRLAYEIRKWRKTEIIFHPYISEANWAPKPVAPLMLTDPGDDIGSPGPLWSVVSESNGHAEAPIQSVHDFISPAQIIPVGPEHAGVDPIASEMDAERRIEDILAIRKNDKTELQRWAGALGCTDLNHHRKWLADWIVKHSRDSADVEQPQAGINSSNLNGRGAAPIPLSPIPNADETSVIAEINRAPSIDALREIHTRWTAAKGPDSWSGDVLAAGHRRMSEIRMREASTQ